MLTEERIEKAYIGKADAMNFLAEAVENVIFMKAKRATELAAKVEAGLYADCKNEDQRKAAAANAFQATDEIIKGAESQEREARLAYDLACNEVAMIETLVRWLK
jgi:hypothetical protein